jgi:hypothetical protein
MTQADIRCTLQIGLLLRLAPRAPQCFSEEVIINRSIGVLQSRKIVGYLRGLAGVLMILEEHQLAT